MATEIRPSTVTILTKLGENTIGVEIGTYYGYNALALALVVRPKILYCVDPWSNYVDPDSLEVIGEAQYLKALECINTIPLVRERIVVLRTTSEQASRKFKDGELDWVYIDGIHDFVNVMTDLKNWYPKVRMGGIISGHDWLIPDVQTAVIAFMETNKLKVTKTDEDWWLLK